MPVGHPLESRGEITMVDRHDEPFILFNDAHCPTVNALGFCQQNRSRPILTSRVNQLATIQELVCLGQGVSLIPEMAGNDDDDARRVYRHLAGIPPRRTIGLVHHAQRTPSRLAESFAQALRDLSHRVT